MTLLAFGSVFIASLVIHFLCEWLERGDDVANERLAERLSQIHRRP